jgi:hypothetical protein
MEKIPDIKLVIRERESHLDLYLVPNRNNLTKRNHAKFFFSKVTKKELYEMGKRNRRKTVR